VWWQKGWKIENRIGGRAVGMKMWVSNSARREESGYGIRIALKLCDHIDDVV
jgi:hypothetical protein